MGNKAQAKISMKEIGVPVIYGSEGLILGQTDFEGEHLTIAMKNETTKKTVLAIMGSPETPKRIKPKETTKTKEPVDLGHQIIGDKTHITDNTWHANRTIAKDINGLPIKNSKGETVTKLNYDKAFYYPGEEFNYKTEYWNGIEGKRKKAN